VLHIYIYDISRLRVNLGLPFGLVAYGFHLYMILGTLYSMCLSIYFLSYSLVLALVVYYFSRPACHNFAFLAFLGFFSGARLLALRPTPNLEDQGVSFFVWLLPFDLSGLGGSTSSYATAGIALRVSEARKLPHHVKVETPSSCVVKCRILR